MPEIGIQTEESSFDIMNHQKINLEELNTLILSGGFLSGYFYLGLSKFIFEHNLKDQIKTYIGSSVGGLFGLFMILDYNQDEIVDLFLDKTMNYYENFNYLNIINFNSQFGIDNGEKISELYKNILGLKTGNPYINFKSLFDLTSKNYIITGTNISKNNTTYYFSYKTTPDMPIWLALRISTSFPLFYTMIKYKGDYFIDGGVSNNVPIEGFEEFFNINLFLKENRKHVLILLLHKFDEYTNNENEHISDNKYNFLSYLHKIIGSLKFQDNYKLKKYKMNVIDYFFDIKLKKNNLVPYKENINKDDILKYIECGYNLTRKYFNK